MKCFPGGSHSKESTCSARDTGLIPGLGKSSEEGNGDPLQYSCLGNPMNRGAWWATVHEVSMDMNLGKLQDTVEEEPGVLQSMESQRVSDMT